MGYALAEAAREAGARVTLVSGPVNLSPPARVECLNVISAKEMYDAVMSVIFDADIFIGVAAVADYRCVEVSTQKISKTNRPALTLALERNPDILASVAALEKHPFVIGFAAETENVIENARAKLLNKKLDMIIANQVGKKMGFEEDDNAVVVLVNHAQHEFAKTSKSKLARELIALIAKEVK
jgi:phosphopantothenoylcysteine decarboxylase/phosphopantothenate--cysteine ligase